MIPDNLKIDHKLLSSLMMSVFMLVVTLALISGIIVTASIFGERTKDMVKALGLCFQVTVSVWVVVCSLTTFRDFRNRRNYLWSLYRGTVIHLNDSHNKDHQRIIDYLHDLDRLVVWYDIFDNFRDENSLGVSSLKRFNGTYIPGMRVIFKEEDDAVMFKLKFC